MSPSADGSSGNSVQRRLWSVRRRAPERWWGVSGGPCKRTMVQEHGLVVLDAADVYHEFRRRLHNSPVGVLGR